MGFCLNAEASQENSPHKLRVTFTLPSSFPSHHNLPQNFTQTELLRLDENAFCNLVGIISPFLVTNTLNQYAASIRENRDTSRFEPFCLNVSTYLASDNEETALVPWGTLVTSFGFQRFLEILRHEGKEAAKDFIKETNDEEGKERGLTSLGAAPEETYFASLEFPLAKDFVERLCQLADITRLDPQALYFLLAPVATLPFEGERIFEEEI